MPVSVMSVIATPSIVQTASCGRVPFETKFDCWPVSLPPTLTRSTSTPLTERSSENGSREVGMLVSSSIVTLVDVPVCLASTIGDAAVTLTVSVSVPIASVTGSSTVWPTPTITRSRTLVVKPCSVDVSLYVAGRELEEAVASLGIGGERLADVGALDRHGDAGQREPGGVADAPGDDSGGSLGDRRKGDEKQTSERETELLERHLTYPL